MNDSITKLPAFYYGAATETLENSKGTIDLSPTGSFILLWSGDGLYYLNHRATLYILYIILFIHLFRRILNAEQRQLE